MFRTSFFISSFFVLLAGLGLSPSALAQDWRVDYGKSWIRFTSQQMGVTMPGDFQRFSVSAQFDPARPESGSYQVELDMASISTGTPDGDAEVQRPAWFDTARHPRADFASRTVRKTAQGYVAQGNLTVKGKTLPTSMAFTLRPMGKGWQADGQYVIKRSDFGIGGGEWADPSVVADPVRVEFRLVLMP